MAEKVKVSREVAKAIEAFKNMQKEKFNITDLDGLLNIATDWWLGEEFYEFSDLHYVYELKFIDFCNALYYGYEIEETPEEKILQDFVVEKENARHKSVSGFRSQGYTAGVKETLDKLKIKIKGIND